VAVRSAASVVPLALTVAPAITAPFASVTIPSIVEVVVCAFTLEKKLMNTNRMHELIKYSIFRIVFFRPLKTLKLEIKITVFLLLLLFLCFQQLTLVDDCKKHQ
jgi:hypothetical protein